MYKSTYSISNYKVFYFAIYIVFVMHLDIHYEVVCLGVYPLSRLHGATLGLIWIKGAQNHVCLSPQGVFSTALATPVPPGDGIP